MQSEAVKNALLSLDVDLPDIPEQPVVADLVPWRDRIDALDRAILQMLNERAMCANVIGHIKNKMGMPVYVPSREEQVIQNVLTANEGPLPNASVQHIFERVIDETRALERQRYQDESETDG